MYVRGDLPQKRFDLELCKPAVNSDIRRIEMLSVELNIKGDKWIIVNMYKKPQTPNAMVSNCVDNVLTLCTQSAPNVILCGDFNINMLSKNNCIQDTLDIHGARNIVKDPKGNDPTLLDLVITNVHKRIINVCCIESGLSDFHKMVCFATKANAPTKIKTIVKYRGYRKFDQEKFEQDLSSAPFHVCTMFDSVNDCYTYVKQLYVDVINAHAPLKTRVIT